jgi:hypothetical protein
MDIADTPSSPTPEISAFQTWDFRENGYSRSRELHHGQVPRALEVEGVGAPEELRVGHVDE